MKPEQCPHLIVGVPADATSSEISAGFARASRRIRSSPDAPFTIDDLTRALHALEHPEEIADEERYALPADASTLDGPQFLPPPQLAPRTSSPPTFHDLESLRHEVAMEAETAAASRLQARTQKAWEDAASAATAGLSDLRTQLHPSVPAQPRLRSQAKVAIDKGIGAEREQAARASGFVRNRKVLLAVAGVAALALVIFIVGRSWETDSDSGDSMPAAFEAIGFSVPSPFAVLGSDSYGAGFVIYREGITHEMMRSELVETAIDDGWSLVNSEPAFPGARSLGADCFDKSGQPAVFASYYDPSGGDQLRISEEHGVTGPLVDLYLREGCELSEVATTTTAQSTTSTQAPPPAITSAGLVDASIGPQDIHSRWILEDEGSSGGISFPCTPERSVRADAVGGRDFRDPATSPDGYDTFLGSTNFAFDGAKAGAEFDRFVSAARSCSSYEVDEFRVEVSIEEATNSQLVVHYLYTADDGFEFREIVLVALGTRTLGFINLQTVEEPTPEMRSDLRDLLDLVRRRLEAIS